jgi:methylmalonyl-CoA mutase N-terminal domain/subunit
VEAGDLVQVGVNAFEEPGDDALEILEITMATETAQIAAVERMRASRDARAAADAIDALVAAADTDANLIESLVDCARAGCTGGEVTVALQGVFGTWREMAAF